MVILELYLIGDVILFPNSIRFRHVISKDISIKCKNKISIANQVDFTAAAIYTSVYNQLEFLF